jgi:hypothetical protein
LLPSGFSISTERIFHFYWADFPLLLSGFSISTERIFPFPSGFSILRSGFFNYTERTL